MATPSPRRMDPDGKRDAILAAGERLFAGHGYTGTTMAEVAREASVAVGTVYRQFPDKPALLAALHRRMEDRFISAMLRGWHAATDHRQRFDPMIDSLLAEAEAVRDIMPLYGLTRDMVGAADHVPGSRIMEAISTMYAEGLDAGAYVEQAPHLAAALGHGLVDGGMRAWLAASTADEQVAVADALKGAFARAFLRDV